MGSAAPSLVHSRRRSPLLLFSFAVLQVCLLDTTAEAMEATEAMVDTVEAMEGTVVDMEAMVIMAREKQRLLLAMEEAMEDMVEDMEVTLEAMGVVMEVVIPEDMVEGMVTMARGKLRLMLNQVIDMVAMEVMEVMGEDMVMVEVMVAMEDLTGDKFFL